MQTAILKYYPSAGARKADLIVHFIGLLLSVLGGVVMIRLSMKGHSGRIFAVAIYACGLISMISFSLAYNFSSGRCRPMLRRLDHIGIFFMIAGTYTPLTTIVLSGGWAWGMTAAVWGLAGLGICGKAANINLPDHVWTGMYMTLGWLVIIAIRPITEHMPVTAIRLLAFGGIVYTTGAVFYVTEQSRFWRSIWHGHVIIAAGAHWAAILITLFWPKIVYMPTSSTESWAGQRPAMVRPLINDKESAAF